MPRRWPRFQVEFDGRDIFSIRVPRSGIVYTPLFERVLAARWWGFSRVKDFFALPGDEQSLQIAAYRAQMQMDAVLAKEEAKKAREHAK